MNLLNRYSVAIAVSLITLAGCVPEEDTPAETTFYSYSVDEQCDSTPKLEFSVATPPNTNNGFTCVMNKGTSRYIPGLPSFAETDAEQLGFNSPCPPEVNVDSCGTVD